MTKRLTILATGDIHLGDGNRPGASFMLMSREPFTDRKTMHEICRTCST